MTRTCFKCKTTKPVEEFSRDYCKPCKAAYAREWRQKNPERVRKSRVAYRLKHRKEIAAYAREWRRKHPDATRQYYLANREEIIAKSCARQQNNREANIEYQRKYHDRAENRERRRQWCAKNRERIREQQRQRRERKRQVQCDRSVEESA